MRDFLLINNFQIKNRSLIILALLYVVSSIELECDFSTTYWNGYGDLYMCRVTEGSGLEAKERISAVIGNHSMGKSNKDVEAFTAWSLDRFKSHFVPTGIGNIFPNLKAIQFVNAKVPEIEREDFENMKNLSSLHLAHNLIRIVPSDALKDLPELTQLYLYGNLIEKLESECFDSLHKLFFIDLSNNKLKSLPPRIFQNNMKLTEMRLFNNGLDSIPFRSFNHLNHIQSLNLRNNSCVDYEFNNTSYDKELIDKLYQCVVDGEIKTEIIDLTQKILTQTGQLKMKTDKIAQLNKHILEMKELNEKSSADKDEIILELKKKITGTHSFFKTLFRMFFGSWGFL